MKCTVKRCVRQTQQGSSDVLEVVSSLWMHWKVKDLLLKHLFSDAKSAVIMSCTLLSVLYLQILLLFLMYFSTGLVSLFIYTHFIVCNWHTVVQVGNKLCALTVPSQVYPGGLGKNWQRCHGSSHYHNHNYCLNLEHNLEQLLRYILTYTIYCLIVLLLFIIMIIFMLCLVSCWIGHFCFLESAGRRAN